MRRLQQLLVLALGFAVAGTMVALGWWQVQVFQAQGLDASRQRAEEPAVPLAEVAAAGNPVRDGFGRSVTAVGTYLPDQQLLVPLPEVSGVSRVLSAFELADGSVVTVVRGVVRGDPATTGPPAPPRGPVTQVGVLLPSEEASSAGPRSGALDSIRIPALAQVWKQRLVEGYIVLAAPYAEAQRIEPAPLVLPEGEGRLRNGAYAIQWWIFAAFAVVMSAKIAKDLGDRDEAAAGIDTTTIVTDDRDRLVG